MRRLFFCLLLITCCNISIAQQNHFIYIQTESRQTFYIKLDKKLYSSSGSGYLILPKLQDGAYTLLLGFPGNEAAEQNISCKIDKKDAGYLLKDFGDKGWGLFNLQTMGITMAKKQSAPKPVAEKETKSDAFSAMLAEVVDDPGIRQKEKEPEKEEIKEEPKVEPVALKEESVKEEKIADPIIEKVTEKAIVIRSKISRSMYNESKDGIEMIYIDIAPDGEQDTIRVFVPAEKKEEAKKESVPAVVKEEVKTVENKQPEVKEEMALTVVVDTLVRENKINEKKDEVSTQPIVKEEKKKEKFIEMELPDPSIKKDTPQAPAVKEIKEEKKEAKEEVVKPVEKVENAEQQKKIKAPIPNSNCSEYATSEDFLKLRKKMAAENEDDEMIKLAKRAFKSKCYTTEQVKNLSVLFLQDKGKYEFFDEAYPFVSDAGNFASLETQLTDTYYIERFKVMIHH